MPSQKSGTNLLQQESDDETQLQFNDGNLTKSLLQGLQWYEDPTTGFPFESHSKTQI